MQEEVIKGRNDAGHKRRDNAGGHYKGEGWCMRTLQKGRDVDCGGWGITAEGGLRKNVRNQEGRAEGGL